METTGLDPTLDEILEFGAIRVTHSSNEAIAFRSFVKPVGPVPPFITELTGITQEMVDNEGEPLEHALIDFLDFIGDLPLIAYNASFDMGFLEEAAKQHGMAINNPYTCALVMASRAWPGLESYKLSSIARLGKLDGDDSHRAIGDCKRTLPIFVAAAESIGRPIKWSTLSRRQDFGRVNTPQHRPRRVYRTSVFAEGDAKGPLHGNVIAFTGALSIPRSEAAALAAAIGCDVKDSITHRTTMLVVGTQDPSVLAGKDKSCKHLKAEAYIAGGQPIQMLNEKEFMQLISRYNPVLGMPAALREASHIQSSP